MKDVQLIAVGEDGQDVPVGLREAYADGNRLDVDGDSIKLLDMGESDRWRVDFATREPVTGKTFYPQAKDVNEVKYEPKRNYTYPVLRPWSDDYNDAEMRTSVEASVVGQDIRVTVDFEVSEPAIMHQVDAGNAQCVAMLYCRDTLHRQMLAAPTGLFKLECDVPSQLLVNDVELHPAIVTRSGLNHSTRTAHDEYRGNPVQIGKLQPLATAHTWRFQVNPSHMPTKSIFGACSH